MHIDQSADQDYSIGYFGDARLHKRGILFCQKMCEYLTSTIRKLSTSRSMEVANHRFLSNRRVTQEEIESSIAKKTSENCAGVDHVLIVNDTSEISYPRQKNKKSKFGPTTCSDIKGFFIHPNIVLAEKTSEVLGLAGVSVWKREDIC